MSAYKAIRNILTFWFINVTLCLLWVWLNWVAGGFQISEMLLVVLSWMTPFVIPPIATLASTIAREKKMTLRLIPANKINYWISISVCLLFLITIFAAVTMKAMGEAEFQDLQLGIILILTPLIGLQVICLNLIIKK